MNESNQEPSANDDAGAGGSTEARRAAMRGDSDEAFGMRQADGLGLSGFYIETDDDGFVPALEYLMNSKAAEADADAKE